MQKTLTIRHLYTKIENGFHFQNEGEFMGYNTKQQDAILSVLKGSKGKHMTADEIYLKLIHQGKPVGKTTVYRHLEKLTADGTIRRYSLGDEVRITIASANLDKKQLTFALVREQH